MCVQLCRVAPHSSGRGRCRSRVDRHQRGNCCCNQMPILCCAHSHTHTHSLTQTHTHKQPDETTESGWQQATNTCVNSGGRRFKTSTQQQASKAWLLLLLLRPGVPVIASGCTGHTQQAPSVFFSRPTASANTPRLATVPVASNAPSGVGACSCCEERLTQGEKAIQPRMPLSDMRHRAADAGAPEQPTRNAATPSHTLTPHTWYQPPHTHTNTFHGHNVVRVGGTTKWLVGG